MDIKLYPIKKMKYILSLLIILSSLTAIGQGTPTYQGNSTSITYNRGTVGALRMQLLPRGFYPFPTFDTLATIWVDSGNTRGLYYHNGTSRLRLATVPYVDSVALSIEAGSVDSSIYSTVNRLYKITDSTFNIIDSNNAIIYGSLSDLYDTKADKDTLGNFVLHTYLDSTLAGYVDTALLNDSLSIFRGLFVTYTGATSNVNLGSKSLTTNKVLADTLGAKSSMGIHMHGTGGQGIMVGAGGGGNITFDAYPTTVEGDSVLTTNSSGGVLRYDLKTKLSTYLLKSDTASLSNRIDLKGNGTVTSIQLVGGTNVTITPTTAITTSGVYTISATGGGGGSPISASAYQMLYKSGGDTVRGTPRMRIDTTDNRFEFSFDSTTSTVTTDPHGGVKMWGSNRMGMGAVRINDTVSIPAALQRAINAQTTSSIIPFNFNNPPNSLSYTGSYLWFKVVSTTYGTPVTNAYSSTVQHLNFPKATFNTTAAANNTAAIRTGNTDGACGLICGNTKFSGGAGRGTFTFAFPTYASTQRIYIGYTESVNLLSGDPSSFLSGASCLMIIKDAADGTLFFAHSSGAGAPTKVNTGITPNSEDVYRLTVYVAPNSTFYAQLEVLSKTAPATVVTINPTTNIPPVGDKLVQQQQINNGTVGGIITYGFIQHMEEVY